MKIGLDAFPLQTLSGGVGYYIYYLLDELIRRRPDDTFLLFTPSPQGDFDPFKRYPNVRIVSLPFLSFSHSLWSQITLAFACFHHRLDLFWGTTQSIPLLRSSSLKTFLTLHDFVYRLCPQTMSPYKRLYQRLFSHLMFRHTDAIVAVSQGTASKLHTFYNLHPTAIVSPPLKPAMHPRLPLVSFPPSLLPKEYLVALGTLEPRKNLALLLEVYLNALTAHPLDQILPLVIIGAGGWKNGPLHQKLAQAKRLYPSHFHLMGYLSEEQIAQSLSGARYCLMMSQYEGYGMPLAEARMCGTAVICLDQPEMREAAEQDGIFLDSRSWQSDLIPYLMKPTPILKPHPPRYLSNTDKAKTLEAVIKLLIP